MTIVNWLQETMIRLRDAGVDSPRRDALVLLEDELGKDRAWVLAHPNHSLQGLTLQRLGTKINRRVKREPLAYIRGKAWFYGRFFEVNPNVLIPRPESENFIELIKELCPKNVLELGTGSGALAITTALELPDSEILATDNDPKALTIAKKNTRAHQVKVDFVLGDMLKPIKFIQPKTTLIANLPYVPDGLVTSPEIKHEPARALFSGEDGLNHYKKMWLQIKQRDDKPADVLIESLQSQHASLETMAKASSYRLTKTNLLIQHYQLVQV